MDRRRFVCAVGGSLFAMHLAATAQETAKVRRIGLLTAGTFPTRPARLPLTDALREHGWIEGQNLIIEKRGADGNAQRVPELAAELVRLDVEVIASFGAVASLAARSATTTIPIVTLTGDPVVLGLVPNLSHPGGNITGVTTISPELAAKRLELLRTLLPRAARIAELVDPANEYIRRTRSDYEKDFRALGMQPIFVDVAAPAELDRSFAEVSRQRAEALIVRADPIFVANRDRIMLFASHSALPTVAEGRQFAEAGALASYAPSVTASLARLAALIDKILRGAKPGDLPIEQPTKLELVINLKTAKALGLSIPQSLLLRADEVIQ